MKKDKRTIRTARTIGILAALLLGINLLTAAGLVSAPPVTVDGTLIAHAQDAFSAEAMPLASESPATPEVTEQVSPCSNLRSNEQLSGTPLTTVSDTCVSAIVNEGTIALDFIPDSFSFPKKNTSGNLQDSFSNDNPETPDTDVASGPEDILTLHDYRNNGGFTVTITSSTFESADSSIPLNDLYIATSYPDENDFALIDTSLNGDEELGVEYAAGSNGLRDINSSAAATGDLGTPESYTVNFDGNDDGFPDVIELMNTSTGHVGRFSQALNFLLKIPPSQPAGAYQVKFTVDLIY